MNPKFAAFIKVEESLNGLVILGQRLNGLVTLKQRALLGFYGGRARVRKMVTEEMGGKLDWL